MASGALLSFGGRNPDVLTCIANLSNDEVFTPPAFANEMLDLLESTWAAANDGALLWADSEVRFLDPFTKSGVFLREIARRLIEGLAERIPDLEARVEHVLTRQVFGIAISELTSLIARRSVYCSKFAAGPYSIVPSFTSDDGNVRFERIQHTWEGKTCRYCGASKAELDRGEGLETHAYDLIHTDEVRERVGQIFGGDMHFDVVVGKPPYQLGDGGLGGSATPIYQKFVQQAKALDPRFLCMVIPARWFAGGRGLTEFRKEMLTDGRLRTIVDFITDKDAFPKVNVNGGITYFLWDRDHPGDCAITTVAPGGRRGAPETRSLNEFDIFVRRNEVLAILRKVHGRGEPTFAHRVSALRPFGLRTYHHGALRRSATKDVKFFGSGKVTWISRSDVALNGGWVDCWKVLIPRATDGNENYPLPIWDGAGPFVSGPGEACSETYLVASLADDEVKAGNIAAYMRTKFFRFMVSIRKITQDNKAENFSFVPDLPMDRVWTDAVLYERYNLTAEEVEFIDSMIRTMDFTNA